MSKIAKKVKDKLKDAKDTVVSSKDSAQEYEASEPMSPTKIREHEPTAVKREMTKKITEEGKRADSITEEARSSMTKVPVS